MTQRNFIRHPSSIPIDAQAIDNGSDVNHTSMINISQGGLSFQSHVLLPIRQNIQIQIPSIDCSFRVTGQVVWAKEEAQGYTIGVIFTDKDEAFHVRMVEQVCHIESYQQENIQKGRDIPIEQAASEWIKHFAADFSR